MWHWLQNSIKSSSSLARVAASLREDSQVPADLICNGHVLLADEGNIHTVSRTATDTTSQFLHQRRRFDEVLLLYTTYAGVRKNIFSNILHPRVIWTNSIHFIRFWVLRCLCMKKYILGLHLFFVSENVFDHKPGFASQYYVVYSKLKRGIIIAYMTVLWSVSAPTQKEFKTCCLPALRQINVTTASLLYLMPGPHRRQ